MLQHYPDKSQAQISNWVGQVWAFVGVIEIGDLVTMPLKLSPSVAFGRVEGNYKFRSDFPSDAMHSRPVTWFNTIPRNRIDQDIRYSLGAFLTVCKIERNDAERRLRSLLDGGSIATSIVEQPVNASIASDSAVDSDEQSGSIEALARDGIRNHIARHFAGHDLAELVRAVLDAQGFTTYLSPPGPDGGIDILAGSGPHGFDDPRFAIQVKSGSTAVDTSVFREFQGVMRAFGTDRGLIVSWSGFKPTVMREVPREFFRIRLWTDEDLIREITAVYEKLPAAIQARLPLKRTWRLVEPGEES